jgi:hypothetical protein
VNIAEQSPQTISPDAPTPEPTRQRFIRRWGFLVFLSSSHLWSKKCHTQANTSTILDQFCVTTSPLKHIFGVYDKHYMMLDASSTFNSLRSLQKVFSSRGLVNISANCSSERTRQRTMSPFATWIYYKFSSKNINKLSSIISSVTFFSFIAFISFPLFSFSLLLGWHLYGCFLGRSGLPVKYLWKSECIESWNFIKFVIVLFCHDIFNSKNTFFFLGRTTCLFLLLVSGT